jgi:amino acid transporter
VNFIGISESVKLNVVLTAIELTGLLLVVGAGLAAIIDGASGVDPGRVLEFKEGESTALAVIAGAGLAFYALIGFEDSMNMAEEVRDPQRAYPRALFGGLAIAGGVYMVVTLVTSAVVPTERLAASDGPLLEVVSVGPWQMSPKLFSAIALFALANGALITMIMTSRGVVTACGLAQGIDLPASVLPFILRNVTLAGIDSVNAPQPVRIEAWTRLATDLDLNKLALATHVVGLADVPDVVARMTDGGVRGRTVVDLNA